MLNIELNSDDNYYNELRVPLLNLINAQPKRILEIGCASGQTLEYLKESKGAEICVGVEISQEVAKVAKARKAVNRVIVGNIEELNLDYPPGYFDLIIASHVLEHMTDPWRTLEKLVSYLKIGGQFVGALPNVRHHSVLIPLIFRGKWNYETSGIMDWTHLRFFTYGTIKSLLEASSELKINRIEVDFGGRKTKMANLLTVGLAKHFLAFAYNFSCYKV
jgi:SAM-dependent methyltransferase